MSFNTIRCRICRNVLVSSTELMLIETQGCFPQTQLFIDENEAPPWIKESIVQGQYIKGKLNCPACHGRIGAFDYVSHIPCQCGHHSLPHIRILVDRVDRGETGGNTALFQKKSLKIDSSKYTVNCNRVTYSNRSEFNQTRKVNHEDEHHNENEHISDKNVDACNELQPETGTSSMSYVGNACDVEHNTSGDVTSGTPAEDNIHSENGNGAREIMDNCDETSNTMECESTRNNDEIAKQDVDSLSDTDTPEKDPLICPICLELFYLPQEVHPCLHVYCDPCLRQLNHSAAAHGQLIRCPMCRVKIKSCKLHKECNTTIQQYFSDEFENRKLAERKCKHKEYPLPGSSMPAGTRRRRARQGTSQHLSVLAGVCFVVMLILLGFTIFAITVGFVSWYLLEVAMDLVVDLAVELQTMCELLRSAVILLCIDGSLKEEYIHALFNSSTRILMAFAKVVGTQDVAENTQGDNLKTLKDHMAERTDQLLTKMTQAAIANYVVVGVIVTYALYRLAKYMQQVRAER